MTVEHEKAFEREVWGGKVGNLPSGLVPARQVLDGRTIILEPLDPAVHGAALYQASHGSEEALKTWEYMPWEPYPSEEGFLEWLRQCAANVDWIWYVCRPKECGAAQGVATYMNMSPTLGVIEIGACFLPEMQRTRAATEAVFLMLDYAMTELRYRRMQWRCNAQHHRSRNAAARLGFRYEGIFYNHMILKGRSRDTACYSILDTDWPEVRKIFNAWLADDNFDAKGVARSSLSEQMRERPVAPRG